MLSANLTKCCGTHVKKLQQMIKLKENEECEESHSNGDHWCKTRKTHATVEKGNVNLETTFSQAKQ